MTCTEIKVPLPDEIRKPARRQAKGAISAGGRESLKLDVIRQLVDVHKDAQTLIIGQYLDQLHAISRELQAPLITGQMTQDQRNEWYNAFREGTVRVLVVSKVANFAVDLPDASVAIEVSGSYGSRQEEAQRRTFAAAEVRGESGLLLCIGNGGQPGGDLCDPATAVSD